MHLRETLEELNADRNRVQQNDVRQLYLSGTFVCKHSRAKQLHGTARHRSDAKSGYYRQTEADPAEGKPYLLLSDEQTPRRARQLVHAQHGRAQRR